MTIYWNAFQFSFVTCCPFCSVLGVLSTCHYYVVSTIFHKSVWHVYDELQCDVIECVVGVWNLVNTWKCSSNYGSMEICCISPFHLHALTHWGRATHICVGKLTTIGSDNGLSPGRRQAIIWTNTGILLIGPLGTHFSEILIGIQTFSIKKMHLKMSSAKWRPFVSASMS